MNEYKELPPDQRALDISIGEQSLKEEEKNRETTYANTGNKLLGEALRTSFERGSGKFEGPERDSCTKASKDTSRVGGKPQKKGIDQEYSRTDINSEIKSGR